MPRPKRTAMGGIVYHVLDRANERPKPSGRSAMHDGRSRMWGALAVAAAFVSLTMLAAAGSADGTEREKLVGLWRGYTVEGKGEKPDQGPVKIELTITEEAIHGIQLDGGKRIDHGEGAFTLDASAEPRQLDAVKTNERGRKESYVGIYSLEGDTLKWCVSRKDRPKTFETVKGQFLLILKRDSTR